MASANLQVCLAEAGDFEAASDLLAELGRAAVTAANREALRSVFLRHIERPTTASLLAFSGGRAVGFMSLEFRERLGRERPQAWVPDLIVSEAARGGGAGKALLQRGIELARERGCDCLTLESSYSRQHAHQFYLRQGMEARGLFFRYAIR